MGGAVQQLNARGVHPHLEVLPMGVHGRLHYSALPVSRADDVPLEKIARARKAQVLRHEVKTGNGGRREVREYGMRTSNHFFDKENCRAYEQGCGRHSHTRVLGLDILGYAITVKIHSM